MQEYVCSEFASLPCLGTKVNGQYQWTTYETFGREIDKCRAALALMGVERGDKVAMIANNREEWAVSAYATYGRGAHFVPMYEAQLPKDWEYILENSDAVVLIVSTTEIYEKTKGYIGNVGKLKHVICLEAAASEPYSWAAWMKKGEENPTPSIMPELDEVAGLIYTSGTTGKPKGVILSHGNFVSNVNAVNQVFPRESSDVSCSFLPWAHSFGQTAELHCMLSIGCSIGIAESTKTLLEDFPLVKPTILFSVPRIFNTIYDKLQKRVAAGSPVKRALFGKALDVAVKRRKLREQGKQSAWIEMQYNLFDKLVFSKIREMFGGHLKYAFSGGAALSKEVGEFIDDIGIVVFEGYGLTETSPIAAANNPEHRKFGTIGVPIPGVSIYICDEDGNKLPNNVDGEIVIVGPNVMQGYHQLDDVTAEVIFDLDGERAFRSGDMGRIDDEGFVKVTGRIKEQYKLENGKYVVPTPLEETLRLSGYIDQCFIYGDNKLYNVCLVVPDEEACRAWCQENGVNATTLAEMAESDKLHAMIGNELKEFAADFKGYERPKKWTLLDEGFTTENGMLTPKMSVKRRKVVEKYRAQIDALYK